MKEILKLIEQIYLGFMYNVPKKINSKSYIGKNFLWELKFTEYDLYENSVKITSNIIITKYNFNFQFRIQDTRNQHKNKIEVYNTFKIFENAFYQSFNILDQEEIEIIGFIKKNFDQDFSIEQFKNDLITISLDLV